MKGLIIEIHCIHMYFFSYCSPLEGEEVLLKAIAASNEALQNTVLPYLVETGKAVFNQNKPLFTADVRDRRSFEEQS